MKRQIAMVLSIMMVLSVFNIPVSYAATDVANSRKLHPGIFTSEKMAGILTDEDSARIKDIIVSGKVTDIDALIDPYFKNCIREEVYVEPKGQTVAEGTTRYRRTIDNSGLFVHQRKYGIWKSIASATISTVLGQVKKVGTILSFVYSVVGGYVPDYEKVAEAQTMYSYRYIEDRGEVYYLDYTYAYRTRAMAVSREKYQHEYGYYTDSQGLIKQHTRDYSGSIETLNAPHKGNSTWLKNKAYNQWRYSLPSYYEDWND